MVRFDVMIDSHERPYLTVIHSDGSTAVHRVSRLHASVLLCYLVVDRDLQRAKVVVLYAWISLLIRSTVIVRKYQR